MTKLYTLIDPDSEEEEEFEDAGGQEMTIAYAAERWEVKVDNIKVKSTREVQDCNDWAEKFKPEQNVVIRNDAPYDGRMYETFGPEVAYVQEQLVRRPTHVWTLLDCDGLMWISPGYHHVNRMGYFITEVPFSKEDETSEGWLG